MASRAGFLLGLFFDPENVSYMLLRNVGWLSTDYIALYTTSQNSWNDCYEYLKSYKGLYDCYL
jgi:hypothetical protein